MADGVVNGTQPAISGIDLPTALGQIQANFAQVAQHIADQSIAHGIGAILSGLAAVVAEVTAARGSRAGLSARLNSVLNQDGSLKTSVSTLNQSEWIDPEWVGLGVSDTFTFTVPGNHADVLLPFRRVCLSNGVENTYGMILGSTYSSGTETTIVTLYDAVVPALLTSVMYGYLTPGPSERASLDGRVFGQNGWIEYNNIGF